jgi:hypothetical protein
VSVFTLELPELNVGFGLVLAITGPFVMFTKCNEVIAVVRALKSRAMPLPQKR